ncbi:MAG TPA: HAMP domain-containing sensor histidine kinase [Kofleriaceae bacterium]|nr:HAMP domain-containing sensor histidine kinase [Kofleriaceae bacterium]
MEGQELHRLFLVVVATSAMRHEVRNKLGTLRNASFYIRRKVEGSEAWKEDVRVPRFFQIIEGEIAAIDQIVTAGVGHVLAEPVIEPIDAGSVAREVVARRLVPAGVTLTAPPSDTDCHVLANRAELELALCILIENAIEAVLDAGGGAVRVTCAPADAGRLAVAVEDEGRGFEGGDVNRWLQPFATTRPGKLGLGLNIARRVAARAGGTLEVTSAPGKGARAAIQLPQSGGRAANEEES